MKKILLFIILFLFAWLVLFPSHALASINIQGDLDHNGIVDIFDYNILVTNFGNTTCGNVADIDGNCKVDIFDYNILVTNFGRQITPNDKSWLLEGPIYETQPYYYGYNGKLSNITNDIPRIAKLGIKTLYIMPIWRQSDYASTDPKKRIHTQYSNIKDYTVDPAYGTSDDLKLLVQTAHVNGIRVLLDLVVSYSPIDSVLFTNHWTLNMPLTDLQAWAKQNKITLQYTTEGNQKYVEYDCNGQTPQRCEIKGIILNGTVDFDHYRAASWGFATDYTNPGTIDYFTNIAASYVKNYDVDGYRLDAPSDNYNPLLFTSDHSITKMLQSMSAAITAIKSYAVLYAENPWIDSNAQKPTFDPVLDLYTNISYDKETARYMAANVSSSNSKVFLPLFLQEKVWGNALRSRPIEWHDHPRIRALNPDLVKPFGTFQSTLTGTPMILTGQEIEDSKTAMKTGLDPVDWAHANLSVQDFYTKVFAVRSKHPALKYGTITNVWTGGDNSYAYTRDYGDEHVLVLINFNAKTAKSTLSLTFTPGTVLSDELGGSSLTVGKGGNTEVVIPAYGSQIFTLK